jgi:His/Glu/Gln/Arg/opine family amino acid ABC transporter permease subunit
MLASGHLANYLLLLLKGLAITLELSLGSLVLGSLGGIVFGAMRSSTTRALKTIALVYIEAVRSIPFVILLFFVFFGLCCTDRPLGGEDWTVYQGPRS